MATIPNEADWKSLHEYGYKILKEIRDLDGNRVPAGETLSPDKRIDVFTTLRGFKNQFNPEGAPGCVLGLPGTIEFCYVTDENGESNRTGLKFKPLVLVNNVGSKFRIYIPPGTIDFKLDLEIDSEVTFACVARLDAPPVRSSLLTIAEYDKALADQSVTNDFYKLMRGEERYFANNKSGVVNVGGHFVEKDLYKIDKGRWLFVTVLNSQLKPDIEDESEEATGYFKAIYKVNPSTYPGLYREIKYAGNDNPVSSADQLVEPENTDESAYKSIHDSVNEIIIDVVDSGYGGIRLVTAKLSGVKEQFNPMGTPGCVLGFEDVITKCLHHSVYEPGYVYNNYNKGLNIRPLDFDKSLSKYRVYIPPGTTEFKLELIGVRDHYAVAVRLDIPPKRIRALTTAEYEEAQLNASVGSDFYKLLDGEELLRAANPAGISNTYHGINMSIGGHFTENETYKLPEGRWLFVNVLNISDQVLNSDRYHLYLQASYRVNKDTFRQLYQAIEYDKDGLPVSSALLANNGGKGPVIKPDTAGIKVTPTNHDVPVFVGTVTGGGGSVGDPNAPPPPQPPEYIFTVEAVPEGGVLERINVFPRGLVNEIGRTNSKVHYKFVEDWPYRTQVGMVNKITFTTKSFIAEATVTSIPAT